MAGMGARQMIFALQIALSDFEVEQSHLRTGMSEQLHHSGESDSRTQHLRRAGMSTLMGNQSGIDSGRSHDLAE